MNKDKILKFIDNQIEEMNRKIRDLEYEGYDCENIHPTIDFFGDMKRLKGSKETLTTMRNIIENWED